MRTITQNTVGGPEVLVIAEIGRPHAQGQGEVLVRVQRRRHQPGRCRRPRRLLPAARRAALHGGLGYLRHRRGGRAPASPASRSATRCSACRASPGRRPPMPSTSPRRPASSPASRRALDHVAGRRAAAGRPHRLARAWSGGGGIEERPARADPRGRRRRRPSRRADRQGAGRRGRRHGERVEARLGARARCRQGDRLRQG